MAPKRHYNSHQMLNAIEAVKKGSKLLTAAKTFGVPRITLRNKITGKSPIICGMGPPSILTEEQESMFVKWLNDMSDKHCPVGKEHLLDSVQQFVIRKKIVNPFTNNRPGKKWFHSFLKRHPGISERISQNFFKSTDTSQEKLESWFSDIYDYLRRNKLQEVIKDPRRIFTSDEAAFYLNPKLNCVLVKRSASNVYSAIGSKKENPRVFLTANAAGQLAPPMVMFADHSIEPYIKESIPEGWGVGRTKTGWMCGFTLYEYMTKIFHPWLIENDITLPVIYFLDGDATHVTYYLSEFCTKNQIELLALYPNSTKISKTMDVALFRPLRAFWKKECNIWKNHNPNHPMKKENFGPILEKALKTVTPASIQNGFKVGGICPFGYKDIDFTQLKTANIEKTEPDPNDITFLNTLEKEIVINLTLKTLDLFNVHYRHKTKTANNLPKEDEALYTIWSKYKDKCQDVVDKIASTVDNTLPYSSTEYEMAQDYPVVSMFTKISQNSLEFENDLKAADSEKSYGSLNDESIPTNRLSSKAATRSINKESHVKMSGLRIKEERIYSRNSKPIARTIRELREFNKKQLQAMLEQHQVIKQETLYNKRKREPEKKVPFFKKPKRNTMEETITSSEDTKESETSIVEYESNDSNVSYYLKEEPKDRVKDDVKETHDKQLSTLDIVKKEIENDSVVICVNDNDVYIMY